MPLAGTEAETLLGSLERQRATFAWKAGGLDAAALRKTVGASSITLGGLYKHLAVVEAHTFRTKFLGLSPGGPWDGVDWDADPDWEWNSAADDTPEALEALWRSAVEDSRAIVAEALAGDGLDTPAAIEWQGQHPSLRRLVADMVEEYARHVGHADLIRESIDGLVGEDPP